MAEDRSFGREMQLGTLLTCLIRVFGGKVEHPGFLTYSGLKVRRTGDCLMFFFL